MTDAPIAAAPPHAGPPHSSSPRMDLTQGPILGQLLAFSLPILGSNVLQSLNGSVNALWVGRMLGPEALTATSNANLVLFFLLGAVFGVGMAATILVGQAFGGGNIDRAKRVVGAAATFFLVVSVLLAMFGYLATPSILAWMQTPPSSVAMAEDYLRIIFLALPFMYFFTFLMMAQRGAGDSRTPFRFMALAVALDIGLNPLLIAGIGPFPQMGIAGSATATLIAQGVTLVLMVATLYLRKADLRLVGPELRYLRPEGPLLRAMVLKGLPMGLQMVVISSSGIVMMSLVNAHGLATAAAFGVALQIWTYVQMPAMAIGAAASSMAAQNVGASRWDRVERVAMAGVAVNIAMTGGLVLILHFLDPIVARLFLPNAPESAAIATHINAVVGWSFIMFGVMFVLFGVVRATGAVLAPLIILFISLYGVRLGFAVLLEPILGADAIWWSFPAGMFAAMAMAIAYYRYGDWRKAQMAPGGAPAVSPAPAPPP